MEAIIRFFGQDDTTPAAKSAGKGVDDLGNKVEKANKKSRDSFVALSTDVRRFAKDIKDVSQFVVQTSGAMVAAFSGAFAAARKDVPEVDNSLKELSNTFQALSDNLAKAALPTLKQFVTFMSGLATAVSGFVERNNELVNSFLKYSAITLALALVGVALTKFVIAMTKVFKLVFQGIGLIVSLATKFSVFGLILGGIAIIMALFGKQILAFLEKIPLIGDAIKKLKGTFEGIQSEIGNILADFEKGTKETLKRTEDLVGVFARGVKSQFNSLAQNVEAFGQAISTSLENAFSDTIYQAITGKIHGLREILKSFADDILRAFSKLIANELLGSLFGDKDGTKKGLFSGIFDFIKNIFGGKGSKSPTDKLKEETDKVAKKFTGLADNMDKFGRAKDRLMENFNRFSRQLESSGAGKGIGIGGFSGSGGFKPLPGTPGFPPDDGKPKPGPVGAISDDTIKSANAMTEALGATTVAAKAAGVAVQGIGTAHMDAAKSFVLATTISLATSLVALAISVAAGTAAAATLAAAWIPAAVAASIATFGGAAAAGGAAVAGAIGSNQALAKSTAQQGIGQGISLKIAGPETMGVASGGGMPHFARGGIVTSPTVGLIGEQGPEAVMPLSKLNDYVRGGGDGGHTIKVDMRIDKAILSDPSNLDQFAASITERLGYFVSKGLKRSKSAGSA